MKDQKEAVKVKGFKQKLIHMIRQISREEIASATSARRYDERILQAENNLRDINTYIQETEAKKNKSLDIDYFDFENYFRGPRETIMQWQEVYLPYFEGRKNVLDLGCGRGEFLELMTKHGFDATGVDLYDKAIDYCKGLGLRAECTDCIQYLGAQEKVGGIFASQLIEHLATEDMVQLLRLAYQKLEDGAYLILETPNPMCLSIFTHAFYIDPSHNKPVHPLTVKYILERAGYREVNLIFPEVSRYPEAIPMLEGDGVKNLDAFNEAIKKLNETVYGCQDYAIIAKK